MKFSVVFPAILLFASCATTPRKTYNTNKAANVVFANTPAIQSNSKYWKDTALGEKHNLSGIHCLKKVDDFELVETLVFKSIPQGLDASCRYRSSDEVDVTFFVAYETVKPPLSEHFDESVVAMTQLVSIFDDAESPLDQNGNQITEYSKAYSITPMGIRVLSEDEIFDSAVMLHPIGNWHVKFRMTYPRSKQKKAGLMAQKLLEQAQSELPTGLLLFSSDTST